MRILAKVQLCSLFLVVLALAACGGGGGSSNTGGQPNTTDKIPDKFNIPELINIQLNTVVTSSEFTVTGINVPTTISITGGEYAINGGNFTAVDGQVNLNDKVIVRLTSSNSYATINTATLTIGGIVGMFNVKTIDQPNSSSPNNFTLLDVALAEPSTLISSNTVTISGLSQSVGITISVGEYSINNSAFTSMPGTIKNGDSLVVRVMSSSAYSKSTTATITVGTLTTNFSVTTVIGKFSWTDPVLIPGYANNILYTREWADNLGNAWIIPLVGTQLGTANYNIYAQKYSVTGGLGAPFAIDDTNTVNYLHTVTGDTKGNVLVTWSRNSQQYYARTYSNGTKSWGPIHLITKNTNPSSLLLMDPIVINDTIYLLSYELSAGVANYYFQSYSDANGWSNIETIYSGGKEYLFENSKWKLSVNANGDAIFFWSSQTDTATSLLKSSRDGLNSVWSAPTPIITTDVNAVISGVTLDLDSVGNLLLFTIYNGTLQMYIATQDANDQWATAIIDQYVSFIKSGDNFVFISEIDDAGICRMISRNYSRNGGFSGAQNIIESPLACSSNSPGSVALGTNRYGDIAMATSIRGDDGIWVANYNGSAWQDITRVDQTAVQLPNPSLTILSDQNGRFFVLWGTFLNTSTSNLATVTRDLDRKWSTEQLIDSTNNWYLDGMNVVVNADGIQVLWRKQPHTTSGNYFATRYATGKNWEPEHPLIAKTALYPSSYNISPVIPLPSGNMLGITYWYDGTTTSAYYSEYK